MIRRLRRLLGVTEGVPYSLEQGRSLQTELSRQLVRLVDVLYALVLVQGAVFYRYIFKAPGYFEHPAKWIPVTLALVLIYFMTVQSFLDYHLASEDQGYQILDKAHRRGDLSRYYLDVVIVGTYSFVLLKSHTLITQPAADLTATVWSLPAVFCLYWVWGMLRRATGAGQRYSARLLALAGALYVVLAVAYTAHAGGSLRNATTSYARTPRRTPRKDRASSAT